MFQAGVFAWSERWNALRLQSGSGRPQKAAIYNSGNRSSFTMQKLWWNVIHRWEMRSNLYTRKSFTCTQEEVLYFRTQERRLDEDWSDIRNQISRLLDGRHGRNLPLLDRLEHLHRPHRYDSLSTRSCDRKAVEKLEPLLRGWNT